MSSASPSVDVSILIPALNEGEHLRNTIDSIRATVPFPCEIIVIDDGSQDGCTHFLRDAGDSIRLFGRPDPQTRLGVSGARNRAATAATGSVLVFLDAHVKLPPGWLQPLMEAIADPNVGAVSPGISVLGHESNVGYGLRWRTAEFGIEWLPASGADPYPVPLLPGCCMVMRRDVFMATGGFDSGLSQWGSEDAEYSLRLWTLGYELQMVPAVIVAHLFREKHPYLVNWSVVLHNMLRVALVHFGPLRAERVLNALKRYSDFARARFMVSDDDIAERREFMRRYGRRNDDAYFASFGDIY